MYMFVFVVFMSLLFFVVFMCCISVCVVLFGCVNVIMFLIVVF